MFINLETGAIFLFVEFVGGRDIALGLCRNKRSSRQKDKNDETQKQNQSKITE